jgi:hypothetical protein
MGVTRTEWYLQLVDTRTKRPIDDDSGVCVALTTGTPVEATIYAKREDTSAGDNPVTLVDGVAQFWTDASVTTLDVSILTASGHPCFVEGLTPSDHRIDVNQEINTGMKLVVPFNINASTSLFDTGFDLNAKHIINDVTVRVTTVGGAGASSTTASLLQVGTSTAITELVSTCQISTTGFYQNVPALTALPAGTGSASMLVGINLLMSATNSYLRAKDSLFATSTSQRIIYRDHAVTGIAGQGYIFIDLDLLES